MLRRLINCRIIIIIIINRIVISEKSQFTSAYVCSLAVTAVYNETDVGQGWRVQLQWTPMCTEILFMSPWTPNWNSLFDLALRDYCSRSLRDWQYRCRLLGTLRHKLNLPYSIRQLPINEWERPTKRRLFAGSVKPDCIKYFAVMLSAHVEQK